MPDVTPLQHGRPVTCSDGSAGSLSDVVIDPDERRVSRPVVEDPDGAARLVPVELLVSGWPPDLEVVRSCAEVSSRATIRSCSHGLLVEGTRQTQVVLQDTRPSCAAAVPLEFVAAIATDRVNVALPTDPSDAFEPVDSRWLPLS